MFNTFSFLFLIGLVHHPDPVLEANISRAVSTWAQENRFGGAVMVLKGDQTIYANAFGHAVAEWQVPNSLDTRFQIGSVTKQFTAYLALRLADMEKLDLHKPVIHYLPNLKADWADKVTLHHLLANRSGLPHYNAIPNYRQALFPKAHDTAEYLALIADMQLEREPGESFGYSSFGYFLVGALLAEVTGKPLAELYAELIFKPFDMNDTFLDEGQFELRVALPYRWNWDDYEFRRAEYRHHSTAMATGGIFSTVGDMAKWSRVVEKGVGLKPETAKRWISDPDGEYGYGWIIHEREIEPGKRAPLIYHDGAVTGYTSEFMWLPEQGAWLIMLSNTRGYKNVLLPWRVVDLLLEKPVSTSPTLITRMVDWVYAVGSEQATVHYQQMKKSRPHHFDFDNWRGLFYAGYHFLNRHRNEDAIALYTLATVEFPDIAYNHEYLAKAQAEAGLIERAIQSYRQALAIDPTKTYLEEHIQALEDGRASP